MDCVGAGCGGSVDDGRDVEVALGRCRRADPNSRVCEPDVRRASVGIAVHGNGLEIEVPAGSEDSDGDLAAVGDEDSTKWKVAVFAQRQARVASRAARLPAQRTTVVRSRPLLERNVPVLLPGVGIALSLERLEAGDEPRPCLGRLDHVVDIAPASGDVGIGEPRFVLRDES